MTNINIPGINITKHAVTFPTVPGKTQTIRYDITQTPSLIDNSDVVPAQWTDIAFLVLKNYRKYNGFVILHGTDTLSWTASMLSYFFTKNKKNILNRPTVITGSQYPLSYLLPTENKASDVLSNFIRAIYVASANFVTGQTSNNISEVAVVFDQRIMRGNRVWKTNSVAYDAFHSVNIKDLGGFVNRNYTIDNQYNIGPAYGYAASPPAAKKGKSPFNNNVAAAIKASIQKVKAYDTGHAFVMLSLFPGIQNTSMLTGIRNINPQLKGLVLLTYGAGNGPSETNFLNELRMLHNQGIVITDITQVISGGVHIHRDATGTGRGSADVISGYNLTASAAFTKLIYLSSTLKNNQAKIEKLMQTPIAADTDLDTTDLKSI